MPSKINRTILRIYRCYHIIHSIVLGCEIMFVSNNLLILVLCINHSCQKYAGGNFAYSCIFLAFDVQHMQLHISQISKC